ncbi:MAG: hypothetical protein M0041_01630 [Nitrospiraceae bacterium]|nr:hypothetical protein [Nitrospiraceae bacterium]
MRIRLKEWLSNDSRHVLGLVVFVLVGGPIAWTIGVHIAQMNPQSALVSGPPGQSRALVVAGNDRGGNNARERIPPDPQEISCRVNRLTDIVFPGKILKVVMSDSRPHDFKLVGTKVGFENHLIVEPLKKGAASDLFIYGTDRVSYLKVKTVPDGQEYDFHFEAKGNRKVSIP